MIHRAPTKAATKPGHKHRWTRDDLELGLLGFPTFVWYALFSYLPMAGIYLAFIDYKPAKGVFGSAFVGLKFFKQFFSSIDCRRSELNQLWYTATMPETA